MRPRAATRASQQETLRGSTGSFSGPIGDVRDPSTGRRIRHAATGQRGSCSARNARTRSRATRVGCPGSSASETVSTACPDGAVTAALPGEESISIPSKDAPSGVRRVSNRSAGQPRSLVNRTLSTRRSSFAHAVIQARSGASRPRAAKTPDPRFRRSGAISYWWAVLGSNQHRRWSGGSV